MDVNALTKLLAEGESKTVEFKEIPNENLYKALSAFANTGGGTAIVGVAKDGGIKGIAISGKMLDDLTNRIVNKLSIYPKLEVVNASGKSLIMIGVAHATYPVSYEGRYYERVGSTTREISEATLRALFLRGKPWDAILGDYSFDEIDIETFNRFVRLAVDNNRLPAATINESPQVVLKKLDLMSDEKLTNGAILLFGKEPQRHFVNLCVRIGRFKTETTIIDDKWVRGNLFQQFEEALNIIKQLISVRYEIKDIERKDIWDYPIPAIREAVLNSLIHRDYFNVANFTLLKIYDDHFWVSNPGKLPEEITVDELKQPHKSYLRNPLIAKAFYLAGFIEQYGSGTVRIVEWMKEAGLPEPVYKEEMGGFSVYFYKDIYTEENLAKMGMNERQIKAVLYVKEKGRITNKEYQELCDVKKRQATNDMIQLEMGGIFKRQGTTGKGTFYTLKAKGASKGHKAQ